MLREHLYFVYMLASCRNGTLYIGVTNEVMRRTWEHKHEIAEGSQKNMVFTFLSGTGHSGKSAPPSRGKSS